MLEIYFNEHYNLSNAKRIKIKHKYEPNKLFLGKYSYNLWFKNEEAPDTTRKSDKEESVDLSNMLLLESDEEVKLVPEETTSERVKLNPRKRKNTVKGLKTLIPSKLLTRLPILLEQLKVGSNSYKLINESK